MVPLEFLKKELCEPGVACTQPVPGSSWLGTEYPPLVPVASLPRSPCQKPQTV